MGIAGWVNGTVELIGAGLIVGFLGVAAAAGRGEDYEIGVWFIRSDDDD